MKRKRVLPQGWKEVVIGEEFKTGSGGTPLSTRKDYYDGGTIPWINSGELNENYIDKTENFITELGLKNSSAKIFPKGTVLVAMYGATAGKTSLLNFDACTNQAICAILENPKFSSLFLKYNLENLYDYLVNTSTGSARDNLSQEGIAELSLYFPEGRKLQEKLIKVLHITDQKIALNTRINAELEAMAKQLYDYWFVQFDFPDENGNPYKSSGGKMVYNSTLKREIPAGWNVSTYGKEFDVKLGGTPSTSDESFWENGTINWLNSGEVQNFPINTSEKKISEDAIKRSSTEFLPKGSVLISITRYLRVTILNIDACINQSVAGFAETDLFKYPYTYFALSAEVPRLMKLRTGAQQPHINKEIIEECPLLLPSKEILTNYYSVINPIFKNLITYSEEIEELTHLRDSLLPMLMNGQVTVE